MTIFELSFGWKLKINADTKIVITQNYTGDIAITYDSQQFGDIQTLLLKIDNENIKIKNLPHVFKDITIINQKIILIEMNCFD